MNYYTYQSDDPFSITNYSAPGFWYRYLWTMGGTITSYYSKISIETVYSCGGELVPYGCEMTGAFDGKCCVDYCLQPGFSNIAQLSNPGATVCENECCLAVCGNGVLETGEECDDGN